MSPYAYNSSNQLTSTPAATFTYDANGNTLTKSIASGTTTYGWDFENRLTSVALPGGAGAVTFKYDPFGRRIQKSSSSGTTNYLYDGGNSVEEVDQTGAELAHYSQGLSIDEPLAAARAGAVGFYEQDGLLSVTSLTGSTGEVLNSYTYDAFGNVSSSTGSFVNPFLYTGRELDSETGLRYYRARYYDPTIGRFISEDPLRFLSGVDDFFAYVSNNPVILKDPTGLKVIKCFRRTRFNGKWRWVNILPLYHEWIKTDTIEAGLGPAGGGIPGAGRPDEIGSPTSINNHAGQSSQPGVVCFEVTDVNEACVNKKLKIGQSQGPWYPGVNDCNSFAEGVLSSCSTKTPGKFLLDLWEQ